MRTSPCFPRPFALVFALVLALVLSILVGPTAALAAGTLRIDFIDVGQGDAALVTSPTGKTVLIDGGPRHAAGALTAFLRAHTRGPLDLILLSHRHEDHLGGLAAAVHDIGARQFMDASVAHATPAYASLMRELTTRQVPVRQATRGRKIDLGGGVILTLVGPPEPAIEHSRSNVNANSVVARLTFGAFAVLFTGDAESQTEKWLLASGDELRADVLKVAHHGSRYASGPRLLKAVGASIAVVSVGKINGYGHPAEPTLARLDRLGTSVFRTDQDGDIGIETDGASIHLRAASGRRKDVTLQ